MTDSADRGWRWTLGTVLCRIVVPLWILTGAFFKLKDGSPRLLPQNTILDPAARFEINLNTLLASLIGLELLAVAVMVLVVRFSRLMTIFMLSCFCLILLNEMRFGAESCGCLGKTSLAPWQMLVVDGVLLIGVLVGRGPRLAGGAKASPLAIPGAVLATIAGFALSFGVILPWGTTPTPVDPVTPNGDEPVVVVDDGTEAPQTDPTQNPSVLPLPAEGYWYATAETFEGWQGKSWKEIDLFRHMPTWPTRMDDDVRYIVFYGRTCDHCEEMFRKDLAPDADLARRTVAIEVPVNKTTLRGDGAWSMPANECEHLQLPMGLDWIITTPLALRLENGIVVCAEEGDHHGCYGLEADHTH